MNRPVLVVLLAAAFTGLAAAPAAAAGPGAATQTHDTLCVQITLANGTTTPAICVPNPV